MTRAPQPLSPPLLLVRRRLPPLLLVLLLEDAIRASEKRRVIGADTGRALTWR